MPIWTDAVTNAIRRLIADTGSPIFTRKQLEAAEQDAINAETGTVGRTPGQTLGRILQELRDDGLLQFCERGTYCWLGEMPVAEPALPGKGVFVIGLMGQSDRLEFRHRFSRQWLRTALRTVGQWILYQDAPESEGCGYYAVAQIARIDPIPGDVTMCLAHVSSKTYLELGRRVPLQAGGYVVERGLIASDGGFDKERANQQVRLISDDDFNRILDLGLIDDDDLLPRIDGDQLTSAVVAEGHATWGEPVDRTTQLVNRTVRDRQFRSRVLSAYGSRCALTGMKLINGGGRAETEAAHIKSVKAGGPDCVRNGLALSGTVHWMFDRGLLSLSDAGDILLSREINDVAGVERLIHVDRKARFPAVPEHRPSPCYLEWHRTRCFHG